MTTIEFYTEQKMSPQAKEILGYAVREVYGEEKIHFKKVSTLKEGVLSFGKRGKGVYTLSPKQIPTVPNALSVLTQSLRVHRDGYPLPEYKYQVVRDPLEVALWLPELIKWSFDKPVALDTEWDKDGNILCLSIYYGDELVTVFSEEVMQDEAGFQAVYDFIKAHYYTVWANGKADQVAVMRNKGIRLPCWFDTMLAHHSLHPSASGQHGLKDMAQRYFGVEDWDKPIYKYTGRGDDVDYGRVPREMLYEYNGMDSFYTFWLYVHFLPMVENIPALWDAIKWANNFVDVETYGVRVDLDAVNDLRDKLLEQEADYEKQLAALGIENPRSPKKILAFLQTLDKRIKDTGEKTLVKFKHLPQVEVLIKYRKVMKQRGTYCDSYLKRADDDGVIHPTFNVHGTGSGRTSGSNPNVQNVPRVTELRNLFIARPNRVLVSTDLAQAELRAQAVLSMDPDLIAAFGPDAGDFFDHSMPAAFPDKFEKPEDFKALKAQAPAVAKDLRAKLKGTIYGLNFGRGAAAIGEALEMSKDEAQAIIDNFFSAYPVWAEWRERVMEAAVDPEKRDFLTTVHGLTFDAEVITAANYASVQRSALSFLPQGNAANVALNGMCEINKRLKADFPTAHITNFIHDDINVDCEKEEADAIGQMMKECLERAGQELFGDVVLFKAEPDTGERWGEIM